MSKVAGQGIISGEKKRIYTNCQNIIDRNVDISDISHPQTPFAVVVHGMISIPHNPLNDV